MRIQTFWIYRNEDLLIVCYTIRIDFISFQQADTAQPTPQITRLLVDPEALTRRRHTVDRRITNLLHVQAMVRLMTRATVVPAAATRTRKTRTPAADTQALTNPPTKLRRVAHTHQCLRAPRRLFRSQPRVHRMLMVSSFLCVFFQCTLFVHLGPPPPPPAASQQSQYMTSQYGYGTGTFQDPASNYAAAATFNQYSYGGQYSYPPPMAAVPAPPQAGPSAPQSHVSSAPVKYASQ